MKKLFSFLILFAALLGAKADNVLFDLGDLQLSNTTNRNVLITPLDGPVASGGKLSINDTLKFNTGTNGSFTITNAVARDYLAVIQKPPGETRFYFTVAASGTNSTVNVADIRIVDPEPDNFAYDRVASESRYVNVDTNGALTGFDADFFLNNSNALNAAVAATAVDTNQFVGTNQWTTNFLAQSSSNALFASDILATSNLFDGYYTVQQLTNAALNVQIATNAANNTLTSNSIPVAVAALGTSVTNTFVKNNSGSATNLSTVSNFDTNTIYVFGAGEANANDRYTWSGVRYDGFTNEWYIKFEAGDWNFYDLGDVLQYHNSTAPWVVSDWEKDGGANPLPIVWRSGSAVRADGADVQAQLDSKLRRIDNGSGLTSIQASNVVSGGQLPAGTLSAGSTNSSGTMSIYVTDGTTRYTTRDGRTLTNLTAANLSGTVADANLSANVPLKNAANTFSAAQTFNGVPIILTNSTTTNIIWPNVTTNISATATNVQSPLGFTNTQGANVISLTSGGTLTSPTVATGFLNCSGNASLGASGQLAWAARTVVKSGADGIITFFNNAQTGFTEANFGGTTASFPAIKRNGAGIDLVGADGVSSSSNNFTLGGVIELKQTSGGTTAADSARVYAKDNGGTAEIFVKDEAGNETQISPHAADAPASLVDATDEMPFITREVNEFTGKGRWINHSREARRTEQLLNAVQVLISLVNTNGLTQLQLAKLGAISTLTAAQKDIVSVSNNYVAPRTWKSVQDEHQAAYDAARAAELAAYNTPITEIVTVTPDNSVELPYQQTNILSQFNTNIVVRPVADIRKPIPAWLQSRGVTE